MQLDRDALRLSLQEEFRPLTTHLCSRLPSKEAALFVEFVENFEFEVGLHYVLSVVERLSIQLSEDERKTCAKLAKKFDVTLPWVE